MSRQTLARVRDEIKDALAIANTGNRAVNNPADNGILSVDVFQQIAQPLRRALRLVETKPEAVVRAELRKQLAHDITSILANPECPTALYNDLASGVLEIFNAIPTAQLDQSVPYTLALLDEYAASQEESDEHRV
ncbi:MAG TPA: hypothetical protein VGB17_02920 [Pyrinomonadaceae bacterium]|jgi:hypothetical protein